MQKKYNIEVDCANCAAKMEAAIKKSNLVKNASINFMTEKMTIEFFDNADEKDIIKKIEKICKKVDIDFAFKK